MPAFLGKKPQLLGYHKYIKKILKKNIDTFEVASGLTLATYYRRSHKALVKYVGSQKSMLVKECQEAELD